MASASLHSPLEDRCVGSVTSSSTAQAVRLSKSSSYKDLLMAFLINAQIKLHGTFVRFDSA